MKKTGSLPGKEKRYRPRIPTVRACIVSAPVVIQTRHGLAKAEAGDYVVTDEDGNESVFPPEAFARFYEEVTE